MQRTCAFGHLYDADLYASCPYCNKGTHAIFFGGNTDTGHTAAPSGFGGGQAAPAAPAGNSDPGRTAAPSGFGAGSAPAADVQHAAVQPNSDPGKTQMPDSMRRRMQEEKVSKTVGTFKKKYGIDPVVGWLVSIEGPDKGNDHRLYSRINTIGREEGNDVILTGDQAISQKNHVKLGYDPKHNQFTLIPGDGHNMVYVNDNPLYIPQVLTPYDIIEIGDTKLIFQPLCSDQFRWPEEKAKKAADQE